MIRWTTPTYELTIEGVDLTGFDVSRSASPGAFYSGSYELLYIY